MTPSILAMRTHSLLFLACALLPAVAAVAQAPQAAGRLSYADTRRPLRWLDGMPSARLAADGKHVVVRRQGKEAWLDPKSGEQVEPTDVAAKDGAQSAEATPWRARIEDGDLVLAAARGAAETVKVTADGAAAGKKTEAQCNAAGTRASFVRDGNLFLVDVAKKELWQATEDGSQEMLHGVLDWVYQEELYGRGDFQGHWWSPSGDHVAVLSLDESQVREFTLVDHVPSGFLDKERSVTTEVANYPKVGDPNPRAMLSILNAAKRSRVAVDLSGYPDDVLVTRVLWTDDGASCLCVLQDRIQTWAELCAIDPETGALSRWIREESASWVNRPEPPRFLADGTFLWLSERTGYQHLYRYEQGGKLRGAVTQGEWQVRSVERVDEAQQTVWFEGTKDGAAGRHWYRIGLDGEGLVLLTPGEGSHDMELSDDGSFLIDRWSAMDMLPKVVVRDGRSGEELLVVGQAELGKAAAEHGFVPRLRLSIPCRDGYVLDGSLMLPPDRPAGALAPIYLPTYSGPDAPSVRDAFAVNAYQQFCAQQGFLVLQVNVRTASGRGHKHISQCYRQLGVQELKDLEDAVAYVCREHGGDENRVAIEGWSYGGFMAAYALTHSDKFQLGLAGAGVYDWRLYDTIYTERYMALPDQNRAGYDATSVIKAAKDLKGHLVLQHGSMDDNVHLQNTMQLLWELQKAGKQNFELMVYPRSQHGPNRQVAAHVKEFQWRRLRQLLDPDWKPQ